MLVMLIELLCNFIHSNLTLNLLSSKLNQKKGKLTDLFGCSYWCLIILKQVNSHIIEFVFV